MATELNPLNFQTASAYLEYILQSEGEILWMHFDEAQRIESLAKDAAYEEGFEEGYQFGIDHSIDIMRKNFQNFHNLDKKTNEQ
jgi:hypothetical protein